MEFHTNQTKPLLDCTSCRGTGAVGIRACARCHQMNFAYYDEKQLLYWGLPCSRYHIALRRAERTSIWVRSGLVLLIAIGCFGLAIFLLIETETLDQLLSTSYWTAEQQTTRAMFFGGLFASLYAWYVFVSRKPSRAVVTSFSSDEPFAQEDLSSAMTDWSQARHIPRKHRFDISKTYTVDAIKAIESAFHLADRYNSEYVEPMHVLFTLLKNPKIGSVFLRLGISSKTVQKLIDQVLVHDDREREPLLGEDFKQIVFHAYDHARMRGQEQVRMTDLLAATVAQSVAIQELLYDLHIDAEKLTNVISWVKIREDLRMQYLSLKKAGSRRSKHGIDRAMTAVATPFLNSFSHDITLSAKYGHLAPCVAREKEIADVFRVIEGGRQSVLLVGDHGVGKMTIVEGIAQLMVEERVPKRLHDKRLVQLSTSALLAGTTVSGAIERLRNMMVEIARAGNVVLCINNLHDLVSDGKTAEKGLDVSEALSEFVGRGHGVLVIATTSVGGYNRTIAHSQLGAGFSRIDVAEMNDNQAIQVLESKVGGIEYKHKVFFSYDALATAVKLAGRFLPDERLPESAVTLIAESASAARSARGEHTLVSDQDIAGIISEKTGIPVTSLDQDERARLLHLEEEMHRRVIGQDTAVSLVANALKRARAEIRSTKRPIANFLFLGPTGVGKTELAKTIAETYFGGEQRMIRIDMSEYQGANSVYRLIGQPGQQGTGILTEAVRQQPFSLVLLDELEKADKDVLNLFLQVFDDGRLTDSVGRTIDFTNTIIIATSNAGTAYVAEQAKAGRSFEEIRQSLIRTELQTYYRPEFINRFDGVVLFQPLSREDIKHIAELMLRRVAGDLKQRGIGFRVEQEALETLADHGYDPEFGARPMRRAIQNYVENALAELILQGSVSRRDTIVLGAGCKLRVEQ